MNAVMTCKLCQTVFPAVSIRKIKRKRNSQTVTESLSNFTQPGLRPVLQFRTHQLHPLQFRSSTHH